MSDDDNAGDAMTPIDGSHGKCGRCKPCACGKMPLQRSLFERLLRTIGWTDLDIERRRRRLALLQLTDEQLKDIGPVALPD